jgi:sec-independent protein translocase protein TatA
MQLLNASPVMLELFSGPHMIWLLVIVVVLFGGKKIPELMKGMGQGIREFNAAKDGLKNEIESGIKEKEKIQAPSSSAGSTNA